MTKKLERTPEPVIAQVPWGTAQSQSNEEALSDAFEQTPDFVGTGGQSEAPIPSQDQIDAAFQGEPVKQASPFAPKPKAKTAVEEEVFEMGDAPSWGDLVRFVQKHGNIIIQARHPKPLGEAVDTIYRGVTVFKYPTCQLRHKDLGWIEWQDAQYE